MPEKFGMMSTRYIQRIFFALAVVATLGLLGVIYQMESSEIRHHFIHETRMIATSIQSDLLNDFRALPADAETTAYRGIKEHLQRLTPHFKEIRFTYLFALRPDGEPVFLVDNEPDGSRDEVTPGMIYEEIDPRMRASLDLGIPFVSQAYSDRWGRWVSAVIPLHTQPESGLKFFFAADIPAPLWGGLLLKPLYGPFWIAAFILVALAGRWIIKHRFCRNARKRARVDLAVFFLTACLLSLVIARVIHRMETHEEHRLFRNVAEMKTQQLREALTDFENNFLRPVAREIALSGQDPMMSFEKAVQAHPFPPMLDAVGWVTSVPLSGRSSFLESMRELDPEFEIWEVDREEKKQGVAERDIYFPVVRVFPRQGVHPARGFDEGSEPRRREALKEAAVTGELTFSAPVALAYMLEQEGNLTCFYPVRDLETENLIGLMVGGVETRQLLRLSTILPHLQSVGDLSEGILYFAKEGKAIPLAYSSRNQPAQKNSFGLISPNLSMTTPLHLGGQTFVLHLYPGPLFAQYHGPWMGWIIGVAGIFSSGIATLGLGALFRHRMILEEEVNKRTRELQESEARFRQLFEESSEAYIWVKGDEIVRGNAALCRMLGCSPDQLTGRHPWEFSPEFQPDGSNSRIRTIEHIKTLLQKGRHEFEWQHQRKDGTPFWTVVHLTRLEREDDPLIFGSVRNITQRKKSMEDNERLRTAVEQADEVVVITDAAGTVEYVNPAFQRTTGYSREEVLGQNPRILKSGQHPESFYREMWETLLAGEKWQGRMANRAKDGSLFHEQASISPVRDKSGKIVNFIAVKRNITRELELEEQFLQSQKMETVGQLAGGVAHDFNNVLQAIMGYASLAAGKLENHPAEEDVRQLIKASQQAAGVTRQLLTFSRRSPMQLAPVNVNEMVEGMLKMIGRLLEDHIDIRVNLSRNLPLVEADAGQLEQSLLNLCINARDAMPKGGVIELQTGIGSAPTSLQKQFELTENEMVFLAVKDTGAGIPPSEIPKIFNPFYTSKKEGQGTGLGLASVYGIVRQHQGAIEVNSHPGEGTTMTIYLPVPSQTAVKSKHRAEAEETSAPRGNGETILLADDYDLILDLTRRILEQGGYRVLTAADGEEALKLIRDPESQIDLVVSDLLMPHGGGREIRNAVRDSHPHLQFLFMSGYDPESPEIKETIEEGDPVEVLKKPFQPEDLLRTIQRIMKRK